MHNNTQLCLLTKFPKNASSTSWVKTFKQTYSIDGSFSIVTVSFKKLCVVNKTP